MIKDIFWLTMLAVGIRLLYYCWRTLNQVDLPPDLPEKQDTEEDASATVERIPFAEASQIWTKVEFAEIAHIWRDIPKAEEPVPRAVGFEHKELTRFFNEQVRTRPFFTGQVLDATIDLLGLLDKHGDCPSVVNRHSGEPELSVDANVFTELAKTPLYLHSIHVAEEAIRRVPKGALVPKAVIAALAHDLGKLPAFYDRFYHSASHAFTGIAVIETLPSVKNLTYFEEIAAAVRAHHQQSEEYLDNIVRESDQAARRMEISSFAATEIRTGLEKCEVPVPPEQGKNMLKPGMADPFGNVVQSKDLFGTGMSLRRRAARKQVDISEWFEQERFIRDLLKIINTAQRGEGLWSALELNGYVYFKPRAFWQVITSHANKNACVVAAALSEQDTDDIIYSVVMLLKKRANTVAMEFIGDGYFGAVFTHNPNASGGKATELYLIPFRAEAFGDNIINTAHKKTALMQNTVSLIPKLHIRKRR